MKHILLWVILYCLLLPTAFALHEQTFYQADLPVSSQAEQERVQNLPKALGQVFIKVSGNSHILDNSVLKSHLSDANVLMQAFSYTSAHDPIHPYILRVQFDQEGVNKILRNASIPIWGPNRPLVLAWVEYQALNQAPEVISGSSVSDLRLLMQHQADERGLPLIFPMMDMIDMSQVTASDISSMAVPTLQNAAHRYRSGAMLIVKLVQWPNILSAQVKFVLGHDQWNWQHSGQTYQEVLTSIMNDATDTLAKRFASVISNQVQSQLTLKIIGVTAQDDFAYLMNYLQHLTQVASVQLVKVSGTEIILNISLRGTQQSFIDNFQLSKKVTPLSSHDSMLIYQWNH